MADVSLADRSQAFAKLQHAQPGVDQDARVFGGQKRGVPGAPARQYAKFEDAVPPESLEYNESR